MDFSYIQDNQTFLFAFKTLAAEDTFAEEFTGQWQIASRSQCSTVHHPCRRAQSEKFYSVPHTSPWIVWVPWYKPVTICRHTIKRDCISLTHRGEKSLIAAVTIVTLPTRDARGRRGYRWEIRTFCSEPQLLQCHISLPVGRYPRQYT